MLRDRLVGMTEPAPDVWEGISAGLDRRHRRMVFRRFAVGAVAAAAGLAIALLVFRGPQGEKQVTAPVQTAQTEQPRDIAPAVPAGDIAPIAEQIASFTKHQAVAQAVVEKPAVEISAEEQVVEPSGAPVAVPAEEPASEPAVGPVEEPAVTEPADSRLTEDQLPADFWTAEDPAESRNEAHTSQITILSNLTAVASDNDLIYKASPSHASSQTGTRAKSQVEPYSESPKFFSPLSLGLQFEKSLSGRLSVSTGLSYTYLVSQYDMLIDKKLFEDAYNQLHYVGIPLSLSYHFVETPSFGFYASAGGAVEKCVSQRYVFGGDTMKEKVSGLQWSVEAGIGAEYWFAPRLGLYFDPSLVYYFDNNQPLSIRTQQPLQARFEVGLRFKL